MHAAIQTALHALQEEEGVRILYACESGSRAWGFPSRDSDYDVRFIYVRRREWYLSIDLERRRDVIERPVSDQLDLSGWDLRKALQLLRKSNPPLLEWLSSPIVYLDQYDMVTHLRRILPAHYSPIASMFHYLHMARGNFRDYLRGDPVWVKKYFYVLRPLLAVKWIEASYGVVPMEFSALVDALVTEPTLKQEIVGLLARKMAGDELDRGPRNEVISSFVEQELTRLESVPTLQPPSTPPIEELNQLFRQILAIAWGD
jgi:predicted nucleotidyltransferase